MKIILFFLILLLFIPIAFSQEKEYSGEVFSVRSSPSEPVVFSDVTIDVGVENTGKMYNDYKLKVFVSKEGEIKYQENFLFSLKPANALFISPGFTPDDIGEYEVLIKLYDKYESELYDMKTIKFLVISHIGPFDLSLQVLSRTVRPGEELPVILRMTNMGERGTDVRIRIDVHCFNQSSPYHEFYVFLESKSSLDRLISMPTCQEIGLHSISSDLILLNKTWISSIEYFFINETYLNLMIKTPELIELSQGGSKVLDIFVENPGSETVHNLKLVVEKIPLEWVTVRPSTIIEVKPNETVLFILNLSVPQNVQIKEYPVKITAASTEVMSKEKSTLKVSEVAALPAEEEKKPLTDLFSWITKISPYGPDIFIALAILVVIVIIIKKIRKIEKEAYRREDILKKLRESINK